VNPDLRKKLVHSLDFSEFQKIFQSPGRPGCFGFSKYKDLPCLKFTKVESPKDLIGRALKLYYSSAGGDDVRRTAEWFQAQWKKHLGLKIELQSEEQTSLSARLRKSPPQVFRRGVPLDRPTCLSGLEIFRSDSPDNLLKISDNVLDKIIDQLKNPTIGEGSREKLCRRGLEFILSLDRMIPLGPIHFGILASPRFKGWRLNSLNQLDLADLQSPLP
jgi:oligopeptide transport system substrate-binding protein